MLESSREKNVNASNLHFQVFFYSSLFFHFRAAVRNRNKLCVSEWVKGYDDRRKKCLTIPFMIELLLLLMHSLLKVTKLWEALSCINEEDYRTAFHWKKELISNYSVSSNQIANIVHFERTSRSLSLIRIIFSHQMRFACNPFYLILLLLLLAPKAIY